MKREFVRSGSAAMARLLGTMILGVLGLILSPSALAQPVPGLLNLQGNLRTESGIPLNKAVWLKVSLYDAEFDGTELYAEDLPLVPVMGGRFAVQIGEQVSLSPGLFSSPTGVWAGISVDGEPELPRQRLVSVPYAMQSEYAAVAATAVTASGLTCGGCVGSVNLATGSVGSSQLASGSVLAEHMGVPCSEGQILKRLPGGWACSADEDTRYAAGPGLAFFDGTTLGLDADHASGAAYDGRFVNEGQSSGVTAGMIAPGAVAFSNLAQGGCTQDQIVKWNGSVWDCGTDNDTRYTSGTGLTLAGTMFALDTTHADGSAWDVRFVNEGQGNSITYGMIASGAVSLANLAQGGCSTNNVMKWSGTAWACATDVNSGGTVTSVATGSGLTGGTITSSGTLAIDANYSGLTAYVKKSGDSMSGPLNLPSNGLVVGSNQLVASGGAVGIGTLPSATLHVAGDLRVDGNIYQYSGVSRARATVGSLQSLPNGGITVVNLSSETFDNLGEFNTSTYRFTASRAGYYQVVGGVNVSGQKGGLPIQVSIRKNGSAIQANSVPATNSNGTTVEVADIVYLNAGDYLQLWCSCDGIFQIQPGMSSFLAVHRLS